MKTYILDTNIILDSPDNLITLSDNGTNNLVLPEVVIDELDNKKSGFEDINYNARQFARLLEDSKIVDIKAVSGLTLVTTTIPSLNITLTIVSKPTYLCENTSTAPSILNDRKILEIAYDYHTHVAHSTIVSLDIMCRTRGLSLGLPVTSLTGKSSDLPTMFHKQLIIANAKEANSKPILDIDPDHVQENYSYTLQDSETGQEFLSYVVNEHLYFIDEADLCRQTIKPLNREQKFFVNSIISGYYDIITVDAKAGSGKSLLAIGTAMRLINKKKYGSIIYIRNSIESTAKGEDVGYLPGLEEKFKIYNHPLYDSLRFIAKAELTKSNSNKSTAQSQTITEDAITARVEELTAKYNIQTMWVGELRGRTLSNSIVIVDEIQNCSASTGQLVLSRLDKDCKVICIGSNRQIDNMYTNKYVNALAKLLKASKATHPNVRLFAGELNKVFRGPIVEFAEEIFK